MNTQPVMVKLLALLLLATVTVPSRDTAASALDVTPSPTVCRPPATQVPDGGRMVEMVVAARPPDGVRITAESVRVAADLMASRLACVAPEATSEPGEAYQIVIRVSAERDSDAAAGLITRTGLVEIIDPRGSILPVGVLVTTSLGGPKDVLLQPDFAGESIDDSGYETIFTGDDFLEALRTLDESGKLIVGFSLTDDDAERFSSLTSANIGNPMAIVLDKRVISTPVIQQTISDEGTIQGPNEDEVKFLAVSLRTKALPFPFELVTVDGTPVADEA